MDSEKKDTSSSVSIFSFAETDIQPEGRFLLQLAQA